MTTTDVSPVKKVVKAKTPAAHPTYSVMITDSIKALKDRTGSSRQAILKYICANYKVDAAKAAVHVRTALKKGVAAETLKMAAAAGKKGAGCYKLGEKAKEVKNPKVAKVKKPVAKKPKAAKKPAAKKAEGGKAAEKKTAAKKPAAKKAIKQPAAAKKSPTKKSASKKPAAKKAAAAKSSPKSLLLRSLLPKSLLLPRLLLKRLQLQRSQLLKSLQRNDNFLSNHICYLI